MVKNGKLNKTDSKKREEAELAESIASTVY
jgi:hypothetical protein